MTPAPIPVEVVATPVRSEQSDVAVIRMAAPRHAHPVGTECLACTAEGDVRVKLFNVLEEVRQGLRAPVSAVLVDASALPSVQPVIDALVPGKLPAFGLRDHAVARSFTLKA